MSVWFTSDTHFGHARVLQYANRPFASIEAHDQALIENWNRLVQPGDKVYHLGDFSFYKHTKSSAIAQQLNGEKYLITGNHDSKSCAPRSGITNLGSYYELNVFDVELQRNQFIVLCHYPIESWNKRHFGAWNLHGHSHGNLASVVYHRRQDVGVDVFNYAPVSYEQLREIMKTKEFKPVDHHQVAEEEHDVVKNSR